MSRPTITLPTYLTLSRFFLVPVFIFLFVKEKYLASVAVLLLAGFTDVADGFIARRFHQRSRLGSMLDPLADKFLMLTSFIFLSLKGHLPWELTFLVIGRDFGILAGVGVLNLLHIKLYYRPTLFSKLTTLFQILVLIFSFGNVFLASKPNSSFFLSLINPLQNTQTVAIWVACALTLVSGVHYATLGYRFYRYGERQK